MKLQHWMSRVDRSVKKTTGQTTANLIFWVVFVVLLIVQSIENTSLIYQEDTGWLSGMYSLRNAMYLVLLIKAGFMSRYRTAELWGVGLLLVVAALTFLYSDDFTVMEFVLIAIAAKDCRPRSVVAVFGAVKTAALALTLGLYAAGALPTLLYENGSKDAYNTFGFVHRNVLGANIAVLCLIWVVLRYRKLKLWDLVLWCAIGAGSYFLAYSRTSLMIMILVIFGAYLFRFLEPWMEKIPHFPRYVCAAILLLFAVSFIGTVFFEAESEFWALVDSVFTKRLRFANQCLEKFGMSLFGQELPFVSSMTAQLADTEKLILDNSYMRSLLYNGTVPCIVFFAWYLFSARRACTRDGMPLVFGLLVFAVYGMSERYMLDVHYNFPLLAATVCCFAHPDRRERERILYLTPLGHLGVYLRWIAGFIRGRIGRGRGA